MIPEPSHSQFTVRNAQTAVRISRLGRKLNMILPCGKLTTSSVKSMSMCLLCSSCIADVAAPDPVQQPLLPSPKQRPKAKARCWNAVMNGIGTRQLLPIPRWFPLRHLPPDHPESAIVRTMGPTIDRARVLVQRAMCQKRKKRARWVGSWRRSKLSGVASKMGSRQGL